MRVRHVSFDDNTKFRSMKGLRRHGHARVTRRRQKAALNAARDCYEPLPGFSLKYFSNLPVSRSNSSRSAGGVPFTVMFGQTLA
jgi:hypothetical protein